MPTVNTYVNERGYYIRARPSGIGNITYKIEKEGHPVLREYGLSDGDEIAWSTIQSLKTLGVIYTEQSGTLGPDDFRPDPEQLEKTKLTESEAEELFSIIVSRFKISAKKRGEIRSTLGLAAEIDLETIGDRLRSYLESYTDTESFTVRNAPPAETAEELDIATWVEDVNSTDHGTWRFHILIINEVNDQSYFTDHCVHLCEEHGIEYWHVRTLESPTWNIKRVAIEQKGVIFPRLLDELQAAGFDPGDPTEVLSPHVDCAESST